MPEKYRDIGLMQSGKLHPETMGGVFPLSRSPTAPGGEIS